MKIYSVTDPEFSEYGKVLEGYDTAELIKAMDSIALPDEGVAYEPWIDSLEKCGIFSELSENGFGGMPIELGMCWGHNKALNCLEYHRGSELNIPANDIILLLAPLQAVKDGKLDTSHVEAFRAPAGTVVQIYETTLHYAPCNDVRDGQVSPEGFRVVIVLPKDTNTEKPSLSAIDAEDKLLWARNKWLIAHPDSNEAKQGAFVGLSGKNIDVARS